MTQEDKQLLFKDLCGRLPYGLRVNFKNTIHTINALFDDGSFWLDDKDDGLIEQFKPYLRPMSSMTDKDWNIFDSLAKEPMQTELFDWLNAYHFDYRGLIEKGLALEAPKNMYKTEQL